MSANKIDNEVYGLIDDVEVVSFDLYDTLILRCSSSPYAVFDLVSKEHCRRTGVELPLFRRLRISAEKAARKNATSEEITMDEIYQQLKKMKPGWPIMQLEELEKEIEIAIAMPNPEMAALFEYCKSVGKTIVITSDMYLDESTILSIISHNGFVEISRLFLSSSLGARKSSGHLYKYVLDQLGIDAAKCLHIGDNAESDVRVAKDMGIKAIHYARREPVCRFQKFYKHSHNDTLMSFFENSRSDDFFIETGREVLGPALLGFSEWLNAHIVDKQPDAVVFLSRDGAIMKRAFEALYGKRENVKYAYCSRRGIIVPTLWIDSDLESIQQRIHFKASMSVADVLDRIGVDRNECCEALDLAGLSGDDVVDGTKLGEDKRFVRLFELVRQRMVDNSKQEFQNAVRYWESIICGSSKVFIVDIGWNGNMQRALTSMFNAMGKSDQVSIEGYYFGLNPWTKFKGSAHGYLFEKGTREHLAERYRCFMSIVELMFMANHGSVKRYVEDEPYVELYPYEYSGPSGQCAETRNAIHAIQQGAIEFINQYGVSSLGRISPISVDDVSSFFIALGERPEFNTAEYFGDCTFYNTDYSYIAKPENGLFDAEIFKLSSWRVGYLKRCFKVRFPYAGVVKLIALVGKMAGRAR